MMPGELMDATPRDPVKAAKQRAERIRKGMVSYVETLEVVVDAYAAHDWEPLGYESWDAYLDGEFGPARLKLAVDDRRRAVEALRLEGMSQRAISSTLGIDPKTVRKDLATQVGESTPPERVQGADGKSYPAQPAEPALAEEKPAADADERERVFCETGCGTQLTPDEAGDGFCRCTDCDPDGDHVSSDGTTCRACQPEPAEGEAKSRAPDAAPAAGEPESEGGPVSPAPDEWAPEPPAGGAVTSATPGNATAEAPGDADPEAEYRPWREHARGALTRARAALVDLTGDLRDPDVFAQRADGLLVDDLDKLVEELQDFVWRVRDLRGPEPATVWIAARRKGIEYHRMQRGMESTFCGRSTASGFTNYQADEVVARFGGKPCPRCWPPDAPGGGGPQ